MCRAQWALEPSVWAGDSHFEVDKDELGNTQERVPRFMTGLEAM